MSGKDWPQLAQEVTREHESKKLLPDIRGLVEPLGSERASGKGGKLGPTRRIPLLEQGICVG